MASCLRRPLEATPGEPVVLDEVQANPAAKQTKTVKRLRADASP
jgi:hypothetical protein